MKLIVLHVTYKEWVEEGGGGLQSIHEEKILRKKASVSDTRPDKMDGVRRCLEDRRPSFVSYFVSPFLFLYKMGRK